MDSNFDHQMSLSKSKCWYSNNYLHFLECAVPLLIKSRECFMREQKSKSDQNYYRISTVTITSFRVTKVSIMSLGFLAHSDIIVSMLTISILKQSIMTVTIITLSKITQHNGLMYGIQKAAFCYTECRYAECH
jgi:hypothetical protein